MKQQHYRVQEVADMAGLSRSTVERDIRAGRLACIQRVPHGTRYVSREDITEWWKAYGKHDLELKDVDP